MFLNFLSEKQAASKMTQAEPVVTVESHLFDGRSEVLDRIVGFEELGNKDDYKTMALEKRMLDAGAIEEEEKDIGDEGKKDEQIDKEELMRELSNRRMKRGFHKTESDEDSDFD